MEKIETLIRDLPDPSGARRFYSRLSGDSPKAAKQLAKDESLLSDVLTISAYSPLLATTIERNPQYIRWLARERKNTQVREKEELLESLGRFALTNTTLEPGAMLARFRRRELIRIFLKDIRGLGTIAEITEEISYLADAVLEHALQLARQELDNRFGMPLESDDQGRSFRAGFCVASLGKLGSKELNYSSDIDLLFIYSRDGSTARGASNREYFVKLSERVTRLVGDNIGEAGAYRVDLRLRPHGRVGALAISLSEAEAYYRSTARLWEKQVLIRSRASAGDREVFLHFFQTVEPYVFSGNETVENALANVLRSKQQIDLEKISKNGFDVKLGKGGIREIEFIAQVLQLVFGAYDKWLRAPHTLISLSRLADRRLLGETELTQLYDAYGFLRRTEHRLQMEQGLQTHLVPNDEDRQSLIAARMGYSDREYFLSELEGHCENVASVFKRFFDHTEYERLSSTPKETSKTPDLHISYAPEPATERRHGIWPGIYAAFEKSDVEIELTDEQLELLGAICDTAPPFAEMVAANPSLALSLPDRSETYEETFTVPYGDLVNGSVSFKEAIGGMRRVWAREFLRIAAFEITGAIDSRTSRELQTALAEASIEAALRLAGITLAKRLGVTGDDLDLAVIGLGKLGGGGLDYHSDLDLVMVYGDESDVPARGLSRREYFTKAVELFVNALSGMTREGSMYRVDLRLRPDGKSGPVCGGADAVEDYFRERSAVWEWLAYVKARGVAGPAGLSEMVETSIRSAIHENASICDPEALRTETLRIRKRLEKEKSSDTRGKAVDIKYGEGGLQDIYFAARYLQLRDQMPDGSGDRSTVGTLKRLFGAGSVSKVQFEALSSGYDFLSELDHFIRLTIGRSTLVPVSKSAALAVICGRMGFESESELLSALTSHRLAVRDAFNSVLQDPSDGSGP